MKRFFALVALVLGLASCQTEPEGLDVQMGGAVDATITVNIPDSETRAGGTNSAGSIFDNVNLGTEEDDNTMRYILMIYDANGVASKDRQVAYSDGKTVNFDVRLVPGRHYSFVVWADYVESKDDTDFHYYTKDGLTNITLNGTWDAMDETRDAFTGVFNTAVDGNKSPYNGAKDIDITLTRPFAKLRVVTTDIKELDDLHIAPYKAVATYTTKHYESFNALKSTYAGEVANVEHTYDIASYDDNVTTGDKQTKVLFTDYFFANNEVVNFTLDVKEQNGTSIKFNTFNTAIPAQRNYLTTISGNILTDGNNVKVDIQDAFENAGNLEDEPYYVEIWDGKTIKAPAQDEAGNYVIERGSELAWVAAAVNGTLPVESRATSYANKTFVLNADIDLGGNEWTPIGVKNNHFNGTFDGNGHIIKGLKITELHDGTNAQAALFGTISLTTTIKNVVIDEAYVKYPADGKDYYASAIAGTIYGNVTFENITVKNSTITGNNKVGAIFAHDGVSNMITINNCHVDNCYIASEDLKDGGNVGGLIGLFQTGSTDACRISNSSVKNSTIVGINSKNTGNRANSQFIGAIATKETTNLVIEKCVVENNEFTQTINGTDAVTYVGAFDNKFIGGDRNENRLGVVIVNGTRYEGTNEPKNVSAEDGEWYATISEAIAAGNDKISLGDGTFTMPNSLSNGAVIEGNGENTVLNMEDKVCSYYNNVTFRNLTMNVGTGNYKGLQHSSNIAYDNCVINGVMWLYATSTFTNCTFNIEGDAYNIWTYGASEATFTKCTFNSDGKSILVYNEGAPAATVTFNECSFNSNGKSFEGKAAVEIDSSLLGDGKHVVRINNCEINGFAAGSVSNNNLYNPKKGNKADIFVDGIQVWAAGYDQLANYPNIFTKDGNYYVFSVAGLQDLNNYFKANWCGNNTWTPEYHIAADINATGFTWDGVYLNVGWNGNNGIVLNGNGHTISNLTINNYLLSGTPCGGNDGVTPGLVKDITMENVVVNGTSHDAAIFWGNCFTNVDFENVTVDGATIKGGSNVGALVSRTSIEGPNTSIKVNFKNCEVKNTTLEADNTNADPTGASGFIGRAYGNTQLKFSDCSVENNTIKNAEGLVGGAVYGYTTWHGDGFKGTGACDTFTNWDGLVFAAQIGDVQYTFTDAVAAAKAGDTITLVEDVTLSSEVTLPAGITLNGNGKQINGTIYAGGNLTFAGHTKVTAFSASYYDRVITIGEGACLEVTGGDRVSLAYGNTFNITGSVENAKTADKTNIQPSLIIPAGISITGGSDATMNVTNAYVKIGDTSSKNSSANGTFSLNINNSIIECTKGLTFAEPINGNNPTFNVKIKDSVLTTGTKLILAAPGCKMNVDNSTINISTYFGNSGVVTLTNGSELTGSSIQDNEGINHRGSTTVDNSTFTINATSTGHAFNGRGTGSITAQNGANVTVTYYKGITITTDATSTFTGTEVQ